MAKKKKVEDKTSVKSLINAAGLKELPQGDTIRFVVGAILLLIAILMLLAFTSNFITGPMDQAHVESSDLDRAQNYGGRLGAYLAYFFMNDCFGICAYFIPIFLLLASMKLMKAYKVRLWKWFIYCTILMIWGSVAASYISKYFIPDTWINNTLSFHPGGKHGDFIREFLCAEFGAVGTFVILLVTAIFYLIYVSKETINVVRKLLKPQDYIKSKLPKKEPKTEAELTESENSDEEETENVEEETNNVAPTPHEDYTVSVSLSKEVGDGLEPALILEDNSNELDIVNPELEDHEEETDLTIEETAEEVKADGKTVEEVVEQEPYDPRKELQNYKFPNLDLLKKYTDNTPAVDMEEQNANKDRIIAVLKSFGVEISSIKATIGPTITLYEITPAQGVRISRIRSLEDDIALSLSALGIRIIAPIPGKGTIGIEVPNKNAKIVSMESILNSKKFQETTFDLPIALGKTITNEVFMVDLAKAPHLLVAGATGQGKSVGLNAIITSLLYKKHPAELKFVMVDPKKVEFSVYSPLENHFLAKIPAEDDPIITDVTKVVQTLKSLCQLMDHRYDLLKKAKVRNIKEYNAKFKERRLNPENGHEFMPYIVVIIDEFGDLIMTAGKEVELPIARIAQLARAVGIHMVIATQRPTTNIITGTIKANFPARMAFKVSSQIDSRTILDKNGANQLIGRGDMLYLQANDPVRVQCAFVDTPEVEQINSHISRQQSYLSAFELPEVLPEGDMESNSGPLDTKTLDPMFEEAARLIVIHQQGSTSLIQRKFSIGYNRAGRLMDQLERAGIVGPTQGSKPRDVLCADETELENKLSSIR